MRMVENQTVAMSPRDTCGGEERGGLARDAHPIKKKSNELQITLGRQFPHGT
jgi:hypothetical protein